MFQTNVPVTAEGFFDRSGELEELERRMQALRRGDPSWVAILGPRKIGKTSLLLELSRRTLDPTFVFVILDSFEYFPLSWEIFRAYGLRCLDAFFAGEIGASLEALVRQPAPFRAALQRSMEFARLDAATRSTVLELPDRRADIELAREVLRWPERLAEVRDCRVVVAWDEFQELASLAVGRGGVDPFPLLRSVWQRHRRVTYFVSGSSRAMLTELVTSERSPFFQHFSLMELSPFGPEDAASLLTKGAPEDRPVPGAVAQRAVEILGGHPFYLQLLGERLTSYDPPYDDATLKEALQGLIFSRTGRLALYFEQRFRSLVGRAGTLAATLNALADGPLRLSEIARAVGAPPGGTKRYLERLAEAIDPTQDRRYRIADPTFALWLRWRRPGGTVVPMSVIGDEAERSVADQLAAYGFDLVYQSRASRGAFDLLATRGVHQLGIQVKRTRLPLRFSKVAWKRMKAEGDRLGWHWVVAAVSVAGETVFLDPGLGRHGKEVRLPSAAAIDNLLKWLDER
jgi:AAA+ ATPase superfamily predicted ATPase